MESTIQDTSYKQKVIWENHNPAQNLRNNNNDSSSTPEGITNHTLTEHLKIIPNYNNSYAIRDATKDDLDPSHMPGYSQSPSYVTAFSSKSPYRLSLTNHTQLIPGLQIDDLITVDPADLDYLSSLSKEYEAMPYLYNENKHPDLHLFEIPWDGGPLHYFVDHIKKYDPILLNKNVSLNDQSLIDFTWTTARISRFFYTFVLFPDERVLTIFDHCFKLGTKSSIFQSMLTYHCAVSMVRIYKTADELELANSWHLKLKIPAFRQCIDYLRQGLESSPTFAELVTLTFAVLIIFSGNTSDESWRTHLHGCSQLINKTSLLLHTINTDDSFDCSASALFDIIVVWYNHTSLLAALTSTNGFISHKINIQRNELIPNISIADNGINLISGTCNKLIELETEIYEFIESIQSRGIRLSGLNLLYFILNEDSHTNILEEIKEFGENVLIQVNNLDFEYQYKRLDIDDIRMDLSLKYCNIISIKGIKLYITYFFIGIRDITKLKSILRDILDAIYSMPYRSACAVVCQWYIYLAGLVSLLLEDFEMYGHFMFVLRNFRLNGMSVQSMDILNRIKDILVEKNYSNLLGPENDFVIY